MHDSVITDELKSLIGKEWEPEIFDVEKGHIRKFAQAVGDTNPLWQDEHFAKNTIHRGIIAPPTFLVDDGTIKIADKLMIVDCPLPAFMNAGQEIELYEPMRPGDVITTRAKLTDLNEKAGRNGALLFMTVEVTCTNQDNKLVCKHRHIFVRK